MANEIKIKLTIDGKEATATLDLSDQKIQRMISSSKKAKDSTDDLTKSFEKMARALLGYFAFSKINDFLKDSIKQFGEEERTINDVYKVVKVAMNSNLDALNTTDRLGEVKHAYCTNDKARGILGYRDTWSLEAGIMKMAEWIRELGPQKPSYRIPLEIEKNAPITWRNRLI